jgi:hypothetical protein
MSDSESASIQKSDSKVENDDSTTESFNVGIPLKYTALRKFHFPLVVSSLSTL